MTIRVFDPNDSDAVGLGSMGVYNEEGFRAWVQEVHLEGYKRDVLFPTLEEALDIVIASGCTVMVH